MPAAPGESSLRFQRAAAGVLVCLPVLFNLIFLYPETIIARKTINDSAFHFAASQRAGEALTSGENPLDAWLGTFSMGYPLWRSYQPFPHLATAVAMRLASPLMGPHSAFILLQYLLLSLLPLCFYAAARASGMGLAGAGAAAALSLAVSEAGQFGRFGIGYGAFVWRGSGLYAQLWGLVFMLLALACFLRAVRTGKGAPAAGLLLALACLSHLIAGYVALVSAALFAVVGWADEQPTLSRRLVRASVAFLVCLLLVAFFVVPMALDSAYANHSRWEDLWKWDSFGASEILKALARGALFDDGRLPVLTVLIGAGLVIAAWRYRRCRTARALLVCSGFWLAVFFGRATWGHLLKLLLIPEDMHIHRLQIGFQVFAVMLAALALETAFLALKPWDGRLRLIGGGVCLALLFCPLYLDRAKYLRLNAHWGIRNLGAYEAERKDIEAALAHVEKLSLAQPGRVHAGRAAGWGSQFEVGSMPVFSLLAERSIPSTSFLYHSLSLASDTMVLLEEERPGDLALFGVRYLLAPEGLAVPPFVKAAGSFGRFRVYEVPGGGFFDLITVPYAFQGNRKTIFEPSRDWLAHPLRYARQHIALYFGNAPAGVYQKVLHRREPLPAPLDADSPPPGQVIRESRKGEAYSAEVRAERSCHVLFRSSFHPGLRARVDGESVEPVMVTPWLTAFPVAAGLHQITVAYSGGILKPVLLVFGLVAAGLLGIASRQGRLQRLETGAPLSTAWTRLEASRHGVLRGLAPVLRRHGAALIVLIAVALLALRPCYRGFLMDGHDSAVYPPRIVEIHENFRNGLLLPVWAPDLGNGFGQPLFEFVPPLFYAVAEVFHVAGAGLADSIQFAALLFGIIAGISMYAIVSRLGSRAAGLVMAAAYLFSAYFQIDLYVRGNFVEFAALAMLPVALWALWVAAEGRRRAAILPGSAAVALLVLSHNAVALVGVPVLAFFGFLLAGARRGPLLRVAASLLGGLAVSAFFWVPALWERNYVHIERLRESFLHYSQHFVFPSQLLYSAWGYGLSVPGPADGMSFMLGPLHLVLALIGAGVVLWKTRLRSAAGRLALASVVAASAAAVMSLGLSKPLWDAFAILQYLQFPWRFLSVASLSLSLLAGLWLAEVRWRPKTTRVVATLVVLVIVLFGLPHARPSKFLAFDDEYYAPEEIARKGINTTTREEYEPVWVKVRPAFVDQRVEPQNCPAGFRAYELPGRTPKFQRFLVEGPGACTVRLNTFYFPGWEISVDGKSVSISVEEQAGRMLFEIPAGNHTVVASLRSTPLRSAGRWISLIAAGLMLGVAMMAVVRSRSATERPPK